MARTVLEGDGPEYTWNTDRKYAREVEKALANIPYLTGQDQALFEELVRQLLSRNK